MDSSSPNGSVFPPVEGDQTLGSPPDNVGDVSEPVLPGLKEKSCRVCGDRALGYNFNALTCESCKAFFRRNASRVEDFRCAYTENCVVNLVTRKFCQKCRLRKCFEVGMKKEWIMTDEARSEKRQRIAENRAKRSGCESMVGSPMLKSPKRSLIDERASPAGTSCYSPASSVSSQHLTQEFSPAHMEHIRRSHNSSFSQVTSPVLLANAGGLTAPSGQLLPLIDPRALAVPGCQYVPGVPVPNAVLSPVAAYANISTPRHSNASVDGAENVSVPKELLLTLLSQCSASLANQNKTSNGQQSTYIERPQCVCRCTCGFYPPGTPLCPRKTDKGVETEKLMSSFQPQDTQPQYPTYCQATADVAGYTPQDMYSMMTNDLLSSGSSIFSMFDAFITSEFQTPPQVAVEQARNSYPGLSPEEQARLNELIEANEIMKEPMERLVGDQKQQTRLIDVINLTDIAIKRIIKMSKRITGFMHLCQEDQIALLKGGCTELMILRGVMTYEPDCDAWHGPSSYIKLDVLKEVKGKNVYEEHKRYLHSFKPEWRTNEALMLILGAITLFTPGRPHVMHKDTIKNEQDAFYSLLKRYLETLYSGCDASNAYEKLVQKIHDLHELNDNAVRIFLDVNPKDVEPLLIEIFDLKS